MLGKQSMLNVVLTAVLVPFLYPHCLRLYNHGALDLDHWWWRKNGSYTVRMVMAVPPVIHLENFVTPLERQYLLRLAEPLFERSYVMLDNGSALLDNARISSSAYLPLGDPIVRRIAQRAAEFQGYMDADRVDVQATAYAEGGHFKPHYDTSPDDANGRQRKSTIFVILDAKCEKCGTIFPNIKADWSGFSKEWCKHLECDESVLATRAVPGSALFWENLDSAGNVLDTSLHGGRPVISGHKVGLNVWTMVHRDEYA
ncbi:hypothetical protein M409DRAFT_54172 [Zasmidium cellare ATCC 36951]|uniref:Prolyl 4-hydroxylase alpha subunit domain-containing protein n=1 Tax=Zasmidium cellare ATCC 36951 TaxID=1080233 RepID=A0A6A6CN62_ZASCE|nr:uncharacterized protein M409DRAFT_54172 [Zasmidium cellare ATCC 36951]KAF2167580.1 hypothetical protein M409DRAFT_54172 [Zasmidium cellare ATCC 36951]